MIIIYVTFKDLEEAKKIGNYLLEKKLIACVNFIPIENAYLWKDKIEKGREIVGILKTKKENWDKVRVEVKKMHSYDVPCIVKIDVEADKDYNDWIDEELE